MRVLGLIAVAFVIRARLEAEDGIAKTCVCPDGRTFQEGAAIFARDSARIVITRLTIWSAAKDELPLCRNVGVVGQVIMEKVTPQRPLYLKRETPKRGTIRDVCSSRIQFASQRKSYLLFEDNWRTIEPRPEHPSDSRSTPVEAGDLTGRDLIRLIRTAETESGTQVEPVEFDERAIKEGAYVVLLGRAYPNAEIGDRSSPGSATTRGQSIPTGTIGRVGERVGYRGGNIWRVEVKLGPAPRPFWRLLFSGRPPRQTSRRVDVREDEMMEVNSFFDQLGVESTQFGEIVSDEEAVHERAVRAYIPRRLPLQENLAIAAEDEVLERVLAIPRRWRLRVKPNWSVPAGKTLILERPDSQGAEPRANLAREQCFFESSAAARAGDIFHSVSADLRIFDGADFPQVPPGYYAIDLVLELQSLHSNNAKLVCRLPWASIDEGVASTARLNVARMFEVLEGDSKR